MRPGAVLGIPLSKFSDVPPVVRRCLDFLEADSVFRLDSFSLQTPSVTEVNRLVKTFEDSDPESVNLSSESPDTVCGVLRKWLRSLPDPVFSFGAYEQWISLQNHISSSEPTLIDELQSVMFQLHPSHYLVMSRILRLLYKLSEYGPVNRLTAQALGITWQPCLLWSQNVGMDSLRLGADGSVVGSIVSFMIEHYTQLFLEDSSWAPPPFDTPALAPVSVSHVPSNSDAAYGYGQQQQYQQTSNPAQPLSSSHDDDDNSASFETLPHSNSSASNQSGSGSQSYQTSSSYSSNPAANQLPPITIPPTTVQRTGSTNSLPVTPSTPLATPNPQQPLARSFAGQPASTSGSPSQQQPGSLSRSNSGSQFGSPAPSTPPAAAVKQPLVINGYVQATSIADFTDMTDGMLQFFKNEQIYVTLKHDDGWWEGWKRGRRGFFPAQYVVENYA